MKKSSLLTVLFVTAACAFLINCGSDKTEIGWINATGGTTVKDIQWIDDSDQVNQTWSGSVANGSQTDILEITKLTGNPKATNAAGTAEVDILVQEGSSTGTYGAFTVDAGTSTRYRFTNTQ